jgi:hypothetical protein
MVWAVLRFIAKMLMTQFFALSAMARMMGMQAELLEASRTTETIDITPARRYRRPFTVIDGGKA